MPGSSASRFAPRHDEIVYLLAIGDAGRLFHQDIGIDGFNRADHFAHIAHIAHAATCTADQFRRFRIDDIRM